MGVGTPGRVLDLYGQKFLSFPWTEIVVLDEADEMLEIGFIDDIKEILSKTPDERQTLLFSATFPTPLLKLARDYTRDPVEVATVSGPATAETVTQSWFKLDREEELPMALLRLIEQSKSEDVFLVFCSRRVDVERLFRKLERSSFPIKALHGGYEQEARFRVMNAFRAREVKALIATDVASRGLDVKHVTHVINCGSPRDITGYTHRVGRTGRAGREGVAISIIAPPNMRNWSPILKQATWSIKEVDPPTRTRQGGGHDKRERGRPQRDGGGRGRSSRREGRSGGRGGRRERGGGDQDKRAGRSSKGSEKPRLSRRKQPEDERPKKERAPENAPRQNEDRPAPPSSSDGFGDGV